ncbi:MAG TPA: hypothetical protein DCM05_15815 [Elusimicrobia bacterium]|nr:hypothetical protein [Elusimicrobiota bacterium]
MSCPACLDDAPGRPLGAHRDPIEGREYRLFLCPACGTSYSEPRTAPGADYYRRVHSGETRSWGPDWREETFFEAGLTPGTLLDVACGEGRLLLAARERGWTVAGVDFNEDYAAAARGKGLDVEAADAERFLSERPARYDAATLFDVLEHAPEPARLLGTLHGALKPGGHLAIAVPNGERPLLFESNRERYDFPPYHFTRWTAASLSKALEKAGFKVVLTRWSPLHFGFFTGLFYYRLLNALFPWLKRLLLGAESAQKTWTDLAAEKKASGALADAGRRQRLVDLGYWTLRVLFFILEAPFVLATNLLAPHKGRTLFVLARKP